jgi:hypothetical protein
MVATKPGHQGEPEVSRKTIAQGEPDDPVEPVVTNSCAFFSAREAAGAIDARFSLRPLFREGYLQLRPGRVRCGNVNPFPAFGRMCEPYFPANGMVNGCWYDTIVALSQHSPKI